MIRLVLSIFCLLLISQCTHVEKKSPAMCILTGMTNGLVDGTPIHLRDVLQRKAVDTAIVKNNRFEFRRRIQGAPKKMVVQTANLSQYKFLWLENKPMVFDASNSDFRFATITGSELQTLSDRLHNITDSLRDDEKRQELEIDFVRKYPSSLQSASMLSVYAPVWEKEVVENLYNNLSDENKETVYGEKIRRILKIEQGDPQIGDQYTEIQMDNSEGVTVNLSDNLGRATLIEFWASWCGPCRKGNPRLVQTYNEYHPEGFQIYAVSLDRKKDKWIEAIEKDGLTWTNVSDLQGRLSKAALMYNVNGIPDNFLLDANGKIVAQNLHGKALDSKIEQLLSR